MKKITLVSVAILAIAFIVSCTKNKSTKEMTPSEILSSTAWETTGAKNNQGESIPLTDPSVAGFVGYAYFKADGKFSIYGLDDTPRSQGDWSISADGKTRTIIGRNQNGDILFTRDVDILILTNQVFTYRIRTDNMDTSIYFDIIHTPTNHQQP